MNEFFDTITEFWQGLPLAVTALLTLAAGWLVAMAARFLASAIMRIVRADKLGKRLGFTEFLRKGGVTYSIVQLAGVLAFWAVIGATLLVVSASLDLDLVTSLWNRVLEVIPGLLAGGLILAIGILVVSFFSNFALTIARNAAMPNGNLAAKGIKYGGILVVALIAMDQIGFKGNILSWLLLIAFGAVCLALALAFGLGCKDLARSSMERFLKNLRERSRGSHPTDLEG